MVLSITGKTCITYEEARAHTEPLTMSGECVQQHSISWHLLSELPGAQRWRHHEEALIGEHHVPAMTSR